MGVPAAGLGYWWWSWEDHSGEDNMVDAMLANDGHLAPGFFTCMSSNNHIVVEKDSNVVAEEQLLRICILRTLVIAQMALLILNDFSRSNLTS